MRMMAELGAVPSGTVYRVTATATASPAVTIGMAAVAAFLGVRVRDQTEGACLGRPAAGKRRGKQAEKDERGAYHETPGERFLTL